MGAGRPARGRPPTLRAGAETRSRITGAAALLMRRRGYHATGLAEVLARGEAPKGSLYHYFPGGKEQLASEAVREGARVVTEQIIAAFAANSDLAGVLRTFARGLAAGLAESGFRDGCPVATVTLDAASDSPIIAEACAAGFLEWRDTIAVELGRWGYSEGDAAKVATLVLSAFEGALLVARATRDAGPLHDVADALGDALGDRGAPEAAR
jgi:TetR/AcrR family transcriptional regulator, lmrAB and yxaGH operons repressor